MDYDEVIAKGRGQVVEAFERYGSYQGEWILLTSDEGNYHLYRDWYGSCSGCDSLEAAEANWSRENNWEEYVWTRERCKEFAKDYKPFITAPKDDFRRIVESGELKSIMPVNIPEYYGNELEKWQKAVCRKISEARKEAPGE